MDANRIVETIPDELVTRWRDANVTASRFAIGGILALSVPLGIAVI